jgi:hypothetical protein
MSKNNVVGGCYGEFQIQTPSVTVLTVPRGQVINNSMADERRPFAFTAAGEIAVVPIESSMGYHMAPALGRRMQGARSFLKCTSTFRFMGGACLESW